MLHINQYLVLSTISRPGVQGDNRPVQLLCLGGLRLISYLVPGTYMGKCQNQVYLFALSQKQVHIKTK